MNREDIIRMAREATKEAPREDWNSTAWVFGDETLERFAALVASAERNRCVARADIALLGADITLRDRVLKAINIRGQA
jgi:hypothetical protein